jgi:polar amino acid transport system substrate-binding protein
MAALGAVALASWRAWGRTPLHLVYFDNFPPLSWRNKQGHMQGMLIDALDEALHRRLNLSIDHQGFPWIRAQSMVKQGQADAFCTVPTPERRAYTEVSREPVITSSFTLFTARHGPNIEKLRAVKRIEELRPFSIGHYLGSGWAQQKLAGLRVSWAPRLDSTLNMLAAGRVDVFIDVAEVVRYRIRELGLSEQLVELPQVLDTQPFNLCIRKNSPYVEILPRFDQVMRQIRGDGGLQELYRKYQVQPPSGG